MTMQPTTTDPSARPPSPWPGSRHETRHSWQLDGAAGLEDAVVLLRELADGLRAAHAAGWELVEPMRNGHLLAARASRRTRAAALPPVAVPTDPPSFRWRLRVVDEPPLAGEPHLDLSAAPGTPLLVSNVTGLVQAGGPLLPASLVDEVARQLGPSTPGRRWGTAPPRLGGPGVDLVADGSALRVHGVRDGVLVRTEEALTFQHAADGAPGLLSAAAAYERIAWAAERSAAAGGRLLAVEDGRLHLGFD